MSIAYDVLDQTTKDRIVEKIEELIDDTHWIDDVIDASDTPNTNDAVKRIIKIIRDAADAVVDL